MSVDTPARIAVLGAGPTGLEAAIYARFLGYDVDVYERGQICENITRWGHVRLFSPFRMNRSALGLSAIRAQAHDWAPPDDGAMLTGRETLEQYFLPLAQTDLLGENVHEQTEVISVGRAGSLKGDQVGDDSRSETSFRILTRGADGEERVSSADVVIDATGTYGNHRWAGQGGVAAVGEHAAQADIEYALPDILGEERSHYEGKHTLLIGSGYSAATSVVALTELGSQVPGTRVTWITREAAGGAPIGRIEDDRLAERDRLAQAANRVAAGGDPTVTHWAGTTVDGIDRIVGGKDGVRFRVRLVGEHESSLEVDRIIANVGYRPDGRIYEELQVHQCFATEGPMKLAAALAEQTSADCLDQTSAGAAALITPEPDFYILGAKSYGRSSRFLMALGLEQIRDLFTIIGDREDLDLYESITQQALMGSASITEKPTG